MKKSIIILLIFSLFVSCSKENQTSQETDSNLVLSGSPMLFFEDFCAVEQELKEVIAMNLEDRKDWEKQNSFNSFGVACDELYYSIIPEDFLNEEDLNNFVDVNKNYLQIVNYNGEQFLESINYKNKYRYLANEDKLFRVGDDIYKVFEETVLRTNIKNKNKIDNIDEIDIEGKKYSEREFSVFYQNSPIDSKLPISKTCVQNDHFTSTSLLQHSFNGDKRESLHVEVVLSYTAATGLDFIEGVEYKVRPYKKVLGIWYWRKANISMDLKVVINSYRGDKNLWGSWANARVSSVNDGRVIEGSFVYNNRQFSNTYYGPTFAALYIKATNSRTAPVEYTYNY